MSKEVPASRLVAATQAAKQSGIPYTSLRDAVFRGELRVVKIGRSWYFDRRDLDSFIETSKTTGENA